MSGTSYSSGCPKCEANMDCYSDWKLYDITSGQCLECGFSYYTTEAQMNMEEVNDLRAERDLPPLKKLKSQTN